MIKRIASALILGLCLAGSVQAAETMDEKEFQKLMKEIGDTTKRFRPGIEGKDTAQVSKDAARLSEINTKMAAFWKARKAEDAEKWSHETAAAATALAASAKAGNWEKAQKDAQGVMRCKACHDAHREKLEDGSYRIK